MNFILLVAWLFIFIGVVLIARNTSNTNALLREIRDEARSARGVEPKP